MLRLQGVNTIIAIIALFILLHLGFSSESYSLRTSVATMLGGIAFLLMTFSIVLTTRLEVFEEMFGGLDRMYQVHRVAGTVATIFVLVHFLGVSSQLISGGEQSEYSLTPSMYLGMISMVLLVLGVIASLNRKISYSRWRLPHKIMGLVYVLVIGHFMLVPITFFDQFSASGILLVIAAMSGIMSLLYTMLGMNRLNATPFRIETVNSLGRATEVVLKPVKEMLAFKPGQFAFVEIQGKGWSEPHPFSICSAPDEDCLRFTMKVLGDWTRKVREELQPGGEVFVHGPYGRFDASSVDGKKQVWLAGGIGVTPFLSKIRAMTKGDSRDIHFFYAVRNTKDAIFVNELKEHAKALGNITLHQFHSDKGEFVSVNMIKEKLQEPLETYEYFISGPLSMADSVTLSLKHEGVKRSKIHTEAFELR